MHTNIQNIGTRCYSKINKFTTKLLWIPPPSTFYILSINHFWKWCTGMLVLHMFYASKLVRIVSKVHRPRPCGEFVATLSRHYSYRRGLCLRIWCWLLEETTAHRKTFWPRIRKRSNRNIHIRCSVQICGSFGKGFMCCMKRVSSDCLPPFSLDCGDLFNRLTVPCNE
jgi:hypothetical protein